MSVCFGGKQFSVVWSGHACDRVLERCENCADKIEKRLMQSLNYAEKYVSADFAKVIGTLTLYDKMNNIFAGLYVNRDSMNIVVTSYGPASEYYPKTGNLTVQINFRGSVRVLYWQSVDDIVLPMGDTCHFNGIDLELRWSKWSAKVMKNDACKQAVGHRRVKEIMNVIESSYEVLPDETLINIWNWLTGIFISVIISYKNRTCDILLYKNTQFNAERNVTHIDITENGCALMLAGS